MFWFGGGLLNLDGEAQSNCLWVNVVPNDKIAIIELSSLAFAWARVVHSAGTSVTISCLRCWSIRCEEKAEEEKYQVHNETVFL